MEGFSFISIALLILATVVVVRGLRIVKQSEAMVIERLGRYQRSLQAGFHILLPFLDVVRYKHSLKERAVDIAEQVCITRDNVQVGVDGVQKELSEKGVPTAQADGLLASLDRMREDGALQRLAAGDGAGAIGAKELMELFESDLAIELIEDSEAAMVPICGISIKTSLRDIELG